VRKKPRSAREAVASGETQRRPTQPARGASPWSEAATFFTEEACRQAEPIFHETGEAEPGRANRMRGSRAERRGRFSSGQALKGGTPGAYPVERHRGGRRRSKASRRWESARAQPDPGEANPGLVAVGGWVTLKGQETSGECS
jgi:hypothetical protein